MRRPIVMGASLAVLLTGSVLAAGDLESGPQVGQRVGVFNPLHVTGPDAGSKNCLV